MAVLMSCMTLSAANVWRTAVLSYSEARQSESSTGGDAKLYMLESIAAEDVVRSEVASVLRGAGLAHKSIGAHTTEKARI